jgi:hypothetical protein
MLAEWLMRSKNDGLGRVAGPLVFGVATLLAAAGAINIVSLITRNGPRVGDIITFDFARDSPLGTDTRLLVHRPDQFACVLDINTLKQNGGSLIVEARMPGETRAVQLHWAGGKTSPDMADCGPSADLIVDHHDVEILAMAAGALVRYPRRPPSA